MKPTVEYVLDWFHIAMRLTVLANTMHDLHTDPEFDDVPMTVWTLRSSCDVISVERNGTCGTATSTTLSRSFPTQCSDSKVAPGTRCR